MAKSRLFTGDVPYVEPPSCGPGRQEKLVTIHRNGRLYRLTLRDKTTVEDPYLVLVKAELYAIKTRTAYAGVAVPRSVRDVLIKSNVTI